MCEACQKCLLAAVGMVKPLHRKEFPLDGVMGLIQQGADHRHLRVGKHRIPAGFLLVEPAPHLRTIGCSSHGSDVIDKVASSLPQGTPPQALALTRPVQQGVKPRVQGLADW